MTQQDQEQEMKEPETKIVEEENRTEIAEKVTEEMEKENSQEKEIKKEETQGKDAFNITVEPPKSPPSQPFITPVPSMIQRTAKPSTTNNDEKEPTINPTNNTNTTSTNNTTTTNKPTSSNPSSVPGSVTVSAFTKDDKTGMATMAGRRHKVALAPGHSHMDWMRKTNSSSNLSGTNGQILRVNRTELRKHNTLDDCWTVIRGKVYNITPGVEELMRGAGRDGTKLFDHKHAWVNVDGFLAKCLVGIFISND